ncbi:predicted protein [Histoplasma capsulatum G186AR]|uniref:Uncharacterized protein n=1 Tax=Ajellomyces capsulatus (strain G186AR / H82 / ATCC MYA-2454 / RMSCC 2432) TaxID=447093 RepID=C0NJT6_AJECG|nr:uncharacterized protein HCBG_03416 [Histoplasma capsulatum G186AR]EEH08127.1 predicted protein [Histoplasma capsulatum G186AR]
MKAEGELRLDKNGSCSDTTLEAGNGRPWEEEREKQTQMKPHRSLQINKRPPRRKFILFYNEPQLPESTDLGYIPISDQNQAANPGFHWAHQCIQATFAVGIIK